MSKGLGLPGGALRRGSGQALRRGSGCSGGGGALRMLGGAPPPFALSCVEGFGVAWGRPSTRLRTGLPIWIGLRLSFDCAALRSGPSTRLRMLGGGRCAQDARRGTPAVRPELCRRVWGMALRHGSGQALPVGPHPNLLPRWGRRFLVYFLVGLFFLEWLGGAPYPFALSCVEGLGLGCLGALACWGMAYEFPSTSLHSAVLRSASLRTNGGAGLRGGLAHGGWPTRGPPS